MCGMSTNDLSELFRSTIAWQISFAHNVNKWYFLFLLTAPSIITHHFRAIYNIVQLQMSTVIRKTPRRASISLSLLFFKLKTPVRRRCGFDKHFVTSKYACKKISTESLNGCLNHRYIRHKQSHLRSCTETTAMTGLKRIESAIISKRPFSSVKSALWKIVPT